MFFSGILRLRVFVSYSLGLVMLSAAFTQCQAASETESNDSAPVAQVAPSAALDTSIVFLDVRTPEEFREGHLRNARLIDLYDPAFEQQVAKLDKNAPYLVYCRTGRRSQEAIRIMQAQGFKNLKNMDGGIVRWKGEVVTD